jgi:hypothetical protein
VSAYWAAVWNGVETDSSKGYTIMVIKLILLPVMGFFVWRRVILGKPKIAADEFNSTDVTGPLHQLDLVYDQMMAGANVGGWETDLLYVGEALFRTAGDSIGRWEVCRAATCWRNSQDAIEAIRQHLDSGKLHERQWPQTSTKDAWKLFIASELDVPSPRHFAVELFGTYSPNEPDVTFALKELSCAPKVNEGAPRWKLDLDALTAERV